MSYFHTLTVNTPICPAVISAHALELSLVDPFDSDPADTYEPLTDEQRGARVETYDLHGRRGQYLRKASRVIWPDGSVLNLSEKYSNREALRRAAMPCNAAAIQYPEPAPKPRYRWNHAAQQLEPVS